MYSQQPYHLFSREDSFTARRNVIAEALGAAERVSNADLSGKPLDAVVEQIATTKQIEVPKLDLNAVEYSPSRQTVMKRNIFGEPFQAEEVRFTFEVPFTGTASLFDVRPSTFTSTVPTGEVRGNKLVLSVQGTDDATQVDGSFKAQVHEVQQYLDWHIKTWADYDAELRRAIRQRLSERKTQVERLGDAEAGLSALGFKRKE